MQSNRTIVNWHYSHPEKKAARDTFDNRVILGPRWTLTHQRRVSPVPLRSGSMHSWFSQPRRRKDKGE